MIETLSKEIPPNSDLHKKLVSHVWQRKLYSEAKMGNHWERWQKADENIVAHLTEKEADRVRKDRRDTEGKLDYITFEVPYYFAVIASMHTYITSVFLGRTPVYQVSGRHGEAQDSVIAMEAALDYQRHVGAHSPFLYNWLWDACKYGVGIIGEYWEEEVRRVSRIIEREKTILGFIGTGKTERFREVMEEIAYQGNLLYNIRPYDFFPDPRLPINNFQRGEFCGRQIEVGLSDLLCQEYQGRYFNIDILKETKGRREEIERIAAVPSLSTGLNPGSGVLDLPDGAGYNYSAPVGKNFVTLLEMCVKIVPDAWGLGKGSRPEKWVFTVANEALLIGCRPLGLFHDRFPYSVLETGFGSEEFIKNNTIDHIRPLAQNLSWLFNTHMFNVRKAINDVRVVDPSRIVMKDLAKPAEGGIIRLKPEFYGTDTRTVVTQLDVRDVTLNHLRDTQVVEQLIQRVSGVTDNVMGLVSEGGRKTATEVRTSSGFAINRLKTVAEYFSALGFSDLAGRLISSTQQLMTLDRKLAVAGSTALDAERFINVTPESLMGTYDFVAVDGTLPIDRLAQANFWKELLMQMARVPGLVAQWDMGKMLAHTMLLQGERNVDKFKINVAPPGAAPGSTLGGNVVPIGGQNNANVRGIPSASGGPGSALPTI